MNNSRAQDSEEKDVQQGEACLWKGFLSNTSPLTFNIFAKKNVTKVSLGSKHCAFLVDRNEIYCHGSGEFGQLGTGKLDDVTEKPILVRDLASENVIDVACGSNHTGVVCSDGGVFCWGDNSAAQCASDKGDKITRPQQVHITNPDGDDPLIMQITCGDRHVNVLSNTGEIWSWGTGHQLGLGTGNNPVIVPQRVEALKGRKVLSISSGNVHSLAIVQKNRAGRSPTRPDDVSYCSKCNQELFSVSDQSDTVIICDHNCPDEVNLRSTPAYSIDSLDVSSVATSACSLPTVKVSPYIKNDSTKKVLFEADEDAKSDDSEGTYTLEDTAKQAKSLEEGDDATDSGMVDDTDQSQSLSDDYDEKATTSFPKGKAAKEFLKKQLAVGKKKTLQRSTGSAKKVQ
uniref:Alsin-like n=1 Tax=Saccoglossus kowalevskii TaxID=10224 RepID=A0ABM0MJF6_SACKO|nr:PREDICTED: alsin-like [Saccoglossus kowalevskii]